MNRICPGRDTAIRSLRHWSGGLLLAVLAMMSPAGEAAGKREALEQTVRWNTVSAHWNNGTLPPPYRRSGSVTIHSDGRGERASVRGYVADAENTVTASFQLTPEQLKHLSSELVRLKAFETRWKELDQHPVGGRMRWVTIQQENGGVSVPPFPVAAQAERAGQIHDLIMSAAPPPDAAAVKTEDEDL